MSTETQPTYNDELNKSRGNRINVALVHWPVMDRAGKVVVTNVTNFDIHDIARASRSYGVENYFIVNKLPQQLMFVSRVLDHWRVGEGLKLNPKRKTALDRIVLKQTVAQAIEAIEPKPLVITTAARSLKSAPLISFRDLRKKIADEPQRPVLLIFGTGNGLHEDVLNACDFLLEPISGASPDEYRHLSVRSAVSICLDRLLGTW